MGETVSKGRKSSAPPTRASPCYRSRCCRARQTLRNLSWFVVRGAAWRATQGRLEYHVTLRVFFRLDDSDHSGESETGQHPPEDSEPSGGKKEKKKKKRS